jgi:3-hydroxy acid dehydrogenase/malonic semialdehyde reductase
MPSGQSLSSGNALRLMRKLAALAARKGISKMSVFITGASSGIGEACARAFAAAGRDLVLAARREEKLTALAHELTSKHRIQVDTFKLDVRSKKAVKELVEGNARIFGGVSVLINNAGMARGLDALQDGNPDDWDQMIDTNFKGLLYVTRAILPQFVAKGEGHIVNIGSVAGYWTYPRGNVYCATKYAVRALTESMRLDLHGTGVRVTEVSPGLVETDFSRVRFSGDEARAKSVYSDTKPLTPSDVAESVLWCVQRPKHVNVQELVIYPTVQASVGLIKRE